MSEENKLDMDDVQLVDFQSAKPAKKKKKKADVKKPVKTEDQPQKGADNEKVEAGNI